jgi:hypothetical protein
MSGMQPAQRRGQVGNHMHAHLRRWDTSATTRDPQCIFRGHECVPETEAGGFGQAPA